MNKSIIHGDYKSKMSLVKCFSVQSNERILSLNVTLLTYMQGKLYQVKKDSNTVGYFIILS